MNTSIWLAILSVLVTLCGTFAGLAYQDVARRLSRLEETDKKLKNAIFTLLLAKVSEPEKIADALHTLLTNGVA